MSWQRYVKIVTVPQDIGFHQKNYWYACLSQPELLKQFEHIGCCNEVFYFLLHMNESMQNTNYARQVHLYHEYTNKNV